jgi:hypothetical protein
MNIIWYLCSCHIHGFWALYIPGKAHKFHSRNELSNPYKVPLANHIVPLVWTDNNMNINMQVLSQPIVPHKLFHHKCKLHIQTIINNINSRYITNLFKFSKKAELRYWAHVINELPLRRIVWENPSLIPCCKNCLPDFTYLAAEL